MFGSIRRFTISPEMSNYIRDSTNKSLEKYLNKYTINANILKDKSPNYSGLLPLAFLISFLAGYNLNLLFTKRY